MLSRTGPPIVALSRILSLVSPQISARWRCYPLCPHVFKGVVFALWSTFPIRQFKSYNMICSVRFTPYNQTFPFFVKGSWGSVKSVYFCGNMLAISKLDSYCFMTHKLITSPALTRKIQQSPALTHELQHTPVFSVCGFEHG